MHGKKAEQWNIISRQFMHESDILIGTQVEVSASWLIANS